MSKKLSKGTLTKVKAGAAGKEKYVLRLFVTGILPNSARAITNCKAICEKYLTGRYDLEIIDIYQQPDLALKEEIIAAPVLIKKFPLPEESVIGDLSETKKVLEGLHLI
ncbi:MAG: circadian clock KaiB family protein [Bacteroidota bacterium]